jgi:hypothetical protein
MRIEAVMLLTIVKAFVHLVEKLVVVVAVATAETMLLLLACGRVIYAALTALTKSTSTVNAKEPLSI